MKSEHQFTKGRNPLLEDKDKLWQARDNQGSEKEVSEFIGSLVRLLKPAVTIETGSYLGDTTITIAEALKANNFGHIYSCDIDQSFVEKGQNRLKRRGLTKWASIERTTGLELISRLGKQAEFAFIDSGGGPACRKDEIEKLYPLMKPLQVIVLHDTAPHHALLHSLAKTINLPRIYLNCPRGLTIFQTPEGKYSRAIS
jgi:predicted O-methyltransferase YrrM